MAKLVFFLPARFNTRRADFFRRSLGFGPDPESSRFLSFRLAFPILGLLGRAQAELCPAKQNLREMKHEL